MLKLMAVLHILELLSPYVAVLKQNSIQDEELKTVKQEVHDETNSIIQRKGKIICTSDGSFQIFHQSVSHRNCFILYSGASVWE